MDIISLVSLTERLYDDGVSTSQVTVLNILYI